MIPYDFHLHSTYSDGHHSIHSIIQQAKIKGVTKLAITDHMTAFGHFLYTFDNPLQSVESYLLEITKIRRKYKNSMEIFAGAEITEDFLNIQKSPNSQDKLQETLEHFSLFLIETIIIREPILTALNMRKYLDGQGYSYIPLILAHPAYSSMDLTTFKLLLNNNIGFELNESKLSQRDAAYFIDHVNALVPNEKDKLQISIGSDAHHLEGVGEVTFASQIIELHHLTKYLITPPIIYDII